MPETASGTYHERIAARWSGSPNRILAPLGGSGLAGARWTFGSRVWLPMAPIDAHRAVINLAPLHRHTMRLEGRVARDAPSRFGALRIAPPDEDGEVEIHGERHCAFAQLYIARPDLENAAESLGLPVPRLRDPRFEVVDGALLDAAVALLGSEQAHPPRAWLEDWGQRVVLRLLHVYGDAPRRPAAAAPAEVRRIQRVIEYIEGDPAGNHSLEVLAKVAELNPFQLSRCFRRQTGMSAHRFIIRARIRRACALLRTRRPVLKDIAHALGFADQSHFTRHFRAHVGVTPGCYAREHGR